MKKCEHQFSPDIFESNVLRCLKCGITKHEFFPIGTRLDEILMDLDKKRKEFLNYEFPKEMENDNF